MSNEPQCIIHFTIESDLACLCCCCLRAKNSRIERRFLHFDGSLLGAILRSLFGTKNASKSDRICHFCNTFRLMTWKHLWSLFCTSLVPKSDFKIASPKCIFEQQFVTQPPSDLSVSLPLDTVWKQCLTQICRVGDNNLSYQYRFRNPTSFIF